MPPLLAGEGNITDELLFHPNLLPEYPQGIKQKGLIGFYDNLPSKKRTIDYYQYWLRKSSSNFAIGGGIRARPTITAIRSSLTVDGIVTSVTF